MSHVYGHPTPTPTSNPDPGELDERARIYRSAYDQGHIDGYDFGLELGEFRIANNANAPVAGEPTHPLPEYDTGAFRSGFLDGFAFGFLRALFALKIEDPTKIPLLNALEQEDLHLP